MRLLFASNLFPPHHLGGYELVCQRIAEGMGDRGHQVRVVTSSFGTAPVVEHNVHRVLSCAYRPPDYFPDAQGDEASSNAGLLAGQIDEFRPDVAVLWNMHGLGIAATYGAALRASTPVATRLGDYQFWPNWDPGTAMEPPMRAILLHPRLRVAANSRTVGKELVRLGLPPAEVAVLHSSVPMIHPKLPDGPPPPPPMRLLWAGRISEHKGIAVACQGAIALARDHQVPTWLDLAGQGGEEMLSRCMGEVEEAGRSTSVDLRVRYLGQLSRNELAAELSAHHAYLGTSMGHDAFPITAIEAMAAGAPVVASRLGGLVEITQDGRLGLMFQPGDPSDLARQLARLAGDGSLRERLRVEARRYAEANFPRQVELDRFEAFLVASSAGLSVSQMDQMVPRMADCGSPSPGLVGDLMRRARQALQNR